MIILYPFLLTLVMNRETLLRQIADLAGAINRHKAKDIIEAKLKGKNYRSKKSKCLKWVNREYKPEIMKRKTRSHEVKVNGNVYLIDKFNKKLKRKNLMPSKPAMPKLSVARYKAF